jgi:Reverse transcriptase (RNA-dependent DNA polymerase)
MHVDDVQYTGFMTPTSKFEWLRMPFGLRNASSKFQRYMDKVFQGIDFVVAYLDDVFVFSVWWEDHCAHLYAVFNRCSSSMLS